MLDRWREGRGAVLRKEYDDIMGRMRDADESARAAFLAHIHHTIDHVIGYYCSASMSRRKAFLEKMRKTSLAMWKSGDWPSALGLGISCLNAQSRVVPGDDAAYVRQATDLLINEASQHAAVATADSPSETG